MDGQLIYRSSATATSLSEIADDLIDIGQTVARKSGMTSVDRVTAKGRSRKLMILGLQSRRGDPPGPRVFGLLTRSEASIEDLDDFLRSVV